MPHLYVYTIYIYIWYQLISVISCPSPKGKTTALICFWPGGYLSRRLVLSFRKHLPEEAWHVFNCVPMAKHQYSCCVRSFTFCFAMFFWGEPRHWQCLLTHVSSTGVFCCWISHWGVQSIWQGQKSKVHVMALSPFWHLGHGSHLCAGRFKTDDSIIFNTQRWP